MSRRSMAFVSIILLAGLIAVVFAILPPRAPKETKKPVQLPQVGLRQVQEEKVALGAGPGEVVLPRIPTGKEEAKRPVTATFFGNTVELSPLVAEGFKPLVEASKRILESAKKGVATAPSPPPKATQENEKLTREEVFRILYPYFYRSVLQKIQDVLVGLGALKTEAKFSFTNEEDIKKFNDVFFGYLRDRKAITEAEYQNYLKGRTALFDRPYEEKYREAQDIFASQESAAAKEQEVLLSPEEAEREVEELLKSQGLPRTFELLPESITSSCNEQDKKYSSVSKPVALLDRFLGAFLPEARAIDINVGGILCFRAGVKGVAGGGANFPTPCCSCKIQLVPAGCLDICRGAAIWDPITAICGCNLGAGGAPGGGGVPGAPF